MGEGLESPQTELVSQQFASFTCLLLDCLPLSSYGDGQPFRTETASRYRVFLPYICKQLNPKPLLYIKKRRPWPPLLFTLCKFRFHINSLLRIFSCRLCCLINCYTFNVSSKACKLPREVNVTAVKVLQLINTRIAICDKSS